MSHPMLYSFRCPVCDKVCKSEPKERFSDFADRVFMSHTWVHLSYTTRAMIRTMHTPGNYYEQTKDGS